MGNFLIHFAGRAAALAAPLALLCIAPAGVHAERGIVSLVFENDIFAGEDNNYTNGVQAAYLLPPDKVPRWAARLGDRLWLSGEPRVEFSIGQNLYTPDSIVVPDPAPGTRPYAGWLHADLGYLARRDGQLDQLRLSVGVIGPATLGEETQEFVHDLVGAEDPQGWDTQLPNEPTLQLLYRRTQRLGQPGRAGPFHFDMTGHYGFAAGSPFTHGEAGGTIRFGMDLPDDYGPLRIQPSLPGSGFFEPTGGFSWYGFIGLSGRLVAYNTTLDGTLFSDSRSVQSEPLVGDLEAGLAVAFDNLWLAYTHVFRTREFKSQNEAEEFGALSLSLRW